MIGVYKITNPKGEVYVGSTINIAQRKSRYKKGYCRGQIKVYRSILKYGWDNHLFEILEICSREELRKKEYEYGTLYNVLGENGLNLVLPKIDDVCEFKSEETKQKMKESAKKRFTPEMLQKMYNGRKKVGWKVSEEHKKKISKTLCKKVLHIETGKIFDSLKEASQFFNIPYGTLTSELSSREKNRPTHYRGRPKKQTRFKYI